MAGLKVKIGADASEFERTMKSVQKQISGVKLAVIGVAAGVGAIKMLGKAFDLAGSGARKLADMIQDASGVAADMEMLSMMFETLTGSSEAAKDMIADFRKEAQKSPLTTMDYANAGKTIMAFGVAAEDVMPALKMLGDVSMGNSERFKSLALAFAQTQAAGRLMGQEVLQFVNAGFNPLQQISKKTGESMKELKKRMEDGGISAQEVSNAFKDATSSGGLFFGALDKGASTTQGKLAKLSDAVIPLKIAFGTGFNEGLKSALDASNEFLPKFEFIFTEAGKTIGTAIQDAVNGDLDKFIAIGEFIGTALFDSIVTAMKVGSKGLIGKFFEGLESGPGKMLSGGLGIASDKLGISEKVNRSNTFDARGDLDLLAQSLSDKLQTMRSQTSTQEGSGGSMWRPAAPGENSPYFDPKTGEKLVQILTKIDNRLNPNFAN